MTQTQQRTEEAITQTLDKFADAFAQQSRAPVLGSPADHGLDYQDVTFASADGVPLEGWFIPAPASGTADGSSRALIANHPMGFSRSGLPAHLEPWRSVWKGSGNDIEVSFLPDYRILHDAGYHVLAYDLRGHGLSGAGNGGLASSGIFEARDVVGALGYLRNRSDTREAIIGLFSRCLGASSTFSAMTQFPSDLQDVRCLLACQPVTAAVILGKRLSQMGLGGRLNELEDRIVMRTGIDFARRSPKSWARNVHVPTYLYQVLEDALTDPSDVQGMYDAMPSKDKQLHWVQAATVRFEGYLEFQRRPQPMLSWLQHRMS